MAGWLKYARRPDGREIWFRWYCFWDGEREERVGSMRDRVFSRTGWFDPEDGGSGSDSGWWVCEQYVTVLSTGALVLF